MCKVIDSLVILTQFVIILGLKQQSGFYLQISVWGRGSVYGSQSGGLTVTARGRGICPEARKKKIDY